MIVYMHTLMMLAYFIFFKKVCSPFFLQDGLWSVVRRPTISSDPCSLQSGRILEKQQSEADEMNENRAAHVGGGRHHPIYELRSTRTEQVQVQIDAGIVYSSTDQPARLP